MKKTNLSKKAISAALAFCVTTGAIFSLASCKDDIGDTHEDDTETTSIVTAETMPPETETTVTETAETEPVETSPLREPVDNEKAEMFVKIKYESAIELLDLLSPDTTSNYYSAENADYSDEEGNLYYKVIFSPYGEDEDPINSVSDLTSYIKSLFAPEYSNDLCRTVKENYKDVDGYLCYVVSISDAETDSDIDGITPDDTDDNEERYIVSEEFFLSRFSETLFRYTEKITYEKMSESDDDNIVYLDYIYENDGTAWRFTAFPLLD